MKDGGATDMSPRIALLEAEIDALRAQLQAATSGTEVILLDDEQILQDVGIYRYHHPLENATAYQDRLKDLSGRIAATVKAGHAIEKSEMFTFDGTYDL